MHTCWRVSAGRRLARRVRARGGDLGRPAGGGVGTLPPSPCASAHSYRRRARKLSEIHRDQRGHPVQRAVYWIEYVLRHGGAPHLRAAVHQLTFCQYFLLDAAAALLLGAAALRWLLARAAALVAGTLGGRWPGRRPRALHGHCQNGVANGKCDRNGHVAREKKAE